DSGRGKRRRRRLGCPLGWCLRRWRWRRRRLDAARARSPAPRGAGRPAAPSAAAPIEPLPSSTCTCTACPPRTSPPSSTGRQGPDAALDLGTNVGCERVDGVSDRERGPRLCRRDDALRLDLVLVGAFLYC